MGTVGAFEAKTHFSRLLDLAARGEEITITRRGEPVARLVPMATAHDVDAAMATFRRMRERARRRGLDAFDWREWKAYVDAGRR